MYKRLYRSRKNKIIAGVAGGLAEYFEIDPVIVRAVFIVTMLGWGVSLLAYIILWIIVPQEDFFAAKPAENAEPVIKNSTFIEELEEKKSHRRAVAGIIFIVIGILWFFNNIVPEFHLHNFWPLVLIAFGVLIILKSPLFSKKHKEEEK
jgi:phage shock protein C